MHPTTPGRDYPVSTPVVQPLAQLYGVYGLTVDANPQLDTLRLSDHLERLSRLACKGQWKDQELYMHVSRKSAITDPRELTTWKVVVMGISRRDNESDSLFTLLGYLPRGTGKLRFTVRMCVSRDQDWAIGVIRFNTEPLAAQTIH